jgi:predicted porin
MKTTKTFAAVAAFTCCIGAHAQTTVTIYGVVDVPVEYLTNTSANHRGMFRVPNIAGSVPSKLGFKAVEDLGGGISASAVLEMGIGVNAGIFNQGSRPFGRQAYVALSGPWGFFGLGRQYTMFNAGFGAAEILGPNMHTPASFDAYLTAARADNSIAWIKTWRGFTAGTTYSFGRDTVTGGSGPTLTAANCPGRAATDRNACREWSVVLKYDQPWGGVAAGFDTLKGGPGAFQITTSSMKDKRAFYTAYVKVAGTKIGAGLRRRDNDGTPATPRSDLWFLGASHPFGPVVAEIEYSKFDTKNSTNDGQLLVGRAIYNLSKRSAVYVSAGRVKNGATANFSASAAAAGGNPPVGQGQTAFGVGIRTSF